MRKNHVSEKSMIPAERQRKILELVMESGSVRVTSLANELDIAENTVRSDLKELHRKGKLVHVRGGAIAKDASTPMPPYSETRAEHQREKAAIGKAALDYLPEAGTILIGSGTTTFQFAMNLPKIDIRVVTNALELAVHLVSNRIANVDFIGGSIDPLTLESDGCLSEEELKRLYWDVTFMGAAAIDINRGITTLNASTARWERNIIERASKVVVLCDSSKLGRFSYVQLGPIDVIDVLITDSGVNPAFVKEATGLGVKVVIADID